MEIFNANPTKHTWTCTMTDERRQRKFNRDGASQWLESQHSERVDSTKIDIQV
jgi:hypothetical protein